MSLRKYITEKIKSTPVTDGHLIVTPSKGSGADISEIVETMIEPENQIPFALFDKDQVFSAAIMDGLLNTESPDDLENFLIGFLDSYRRGSVSVEGWRSKQVTNIATGYFGYKGEIDKEMMERENMSIMDRLKK